VMCPHRSSVAGRWPTCLMRGQRVKRSRGHLPNFVGEGRGSLGEYALLKDLGKKALGWVRPPPGPGRGLWLGRALHRLFGSRCEGHRL